MLVTERILKMLAERGEDIGLVDALDAVDHGRQTLQAHTRVDPSTLQRFPRAIGGLVELHEDQVPDLEVPLAVSRVTVRPAAAGARAEIEVHLGVGTAGPRGSGRSPEVVLQLLTNQTVNVRFVEFIVGHVSLKGCLCQFAKLSLLMPAWRCKNPNLATVKLRIGSIKNNLKTTLWGTIVIFDRIRENLRFGGAQRLLRQNFEAVVNLSIIQSLARSLNTSLTVIFVLLALLLLAPQSIKGFALALLIGIVSGTYSSVFNASPLLVAWKDWESSGR